ncbi:hypothetical protein BDW75DRAFT_243118 [Aspergillus navahoensis]
MVWELVETDPQGRHLSVLGTAAIDCCAPAASRFKVYESTDNTSFDHIAAAMALGGPKPESAKSIAQPKELWYGLEGLDADFDLVRAFTERQSCDATFYFDIHPKSPFSHVKLQIDVSKHSESHLDAIQVVWADGISEALRARRGLQAFFTFAFKNGEEDITSYFQPQIHLVREVVVMATVLLEVMDQSAKDYFELD